MTTQAASTLRATALIAAALLASGCATFSPVQTDEDYEAADGVRLSITDLELRNLAFVATQEGGTGLLIGQAVNRASSAVDVEFSVEGGQPQQVTVPAASGDTLSDEVARVEMPALPAGPGRTIELVVTTDAAGRNVVTVPVLQAKGPYEGLVVG